MNKNIQRWIQEGYDRYVCTRERLLHQKWRSCRPGEKKISVAIPHWHRAKFIHQPLWNILYDERVEEIVIIDDGSSEEEFSLLEKNIRQYDRRKIVTIYRREENRGAQFTKMECVEKTKGNWMILLDADNTILPSYLNRVTSLQQRDEDTLYCPDWAFPYFSFLKLSGVSIDFQKACLLTQKKFLRKLALINDGNFFFNRKNYFSSLLKIREVKSDVADVILSNYYWLSHGKKLQILQRAFYVHRLHQESFWARTKELSRKRVMTILDRFEKELPWDGEFEKSIIAG